MASAARRNGDSRSRDKEAAQGGERCPGAHDHAHHGSTTPTPSPTGDGRDAAPGHGLPARGPPSPPAGACRPRATASSPSRRRRGRRACARLGQAATARYLLGRDALARDAIWHDLKRFERGGAMRPRGPWTSPCGTSPARCTTRPSGSCWAAGGRSARLRQHLPRRRARGADPAGGLRRVRPALQGGLRLPGVQDPRLGHRPRRPATPPRWSPPGRRWATGWT